MAGGERPGDGSLASSMAGVCKALLRNYYLGIFTKLEDYEQRFPGGSI